MSVAPMPPMTRTPAVMEIEPCPFCRAHASVFQDDGDYYVSCTECWSQSPLKEEKTEAIAAWNRRTPAEPLADGEMIENPVCTRCGCFKEAHGEDLRCEPVGWTFTAEPNPNDRLREALEACRAKFDHYEQLHRLKCTAEGDEKADRNREMVVMIDAALSHKD